jgi:hypothetical protein
MVAKAASRNEPFGISENGVIANTASEGGPALLSEIHCIIRIVLKYYCVRSLSRPVPEVIMPHVPESSPRLQRMALLG